MFASVNMPYRSGYIGSLRGVASKSLIREEPIWMRFIPDKNPLNPIMPDYQGRDIEDLSYRPLGEWGWYRPLHDVLMEDADQDGIPAIYDINPFGSFLYGTDYPVAETLTPNIERQMMMEDDDEDYA